MISTLMIAAITSQDKCHGSGSGRLRYPRDCIMADGFQTSLNISCSI